MKRLIAAGGLLAGLVFGMLWVGIGSASAHDSTDGTTLAACGTTLPLTTPCAATVANSSGTYTVTVPGVGTVTFTLAGDGDDPTGVTATPASGFTASTAVSKGDKAAVTFTSTSNPAQHYTVVVRARQPAGATTPTVKATVVSGRICDHPGDPGTWDSRSGPSGGDGQYRGGDPGGSRGGSGGSWSGSGFGGR